MEEKTRVINQLEEYFKEAGIQIERKEDLLVLFNATICPLFVGTVLDRYVLISTYSLLPKTTEPISNEDLRSLYYALLAENDFTKWGKYCLDDNQDNAIAFVVKFRFQDLSKDFTFDILHQIRESLEVRLPNIINK